MKVPLIFHQKLLNWNAALVFDDLVKKFLQNFQEENHDPKIDQKIRLLIHKRRRITIMGTIDRDKFEIIVTKTTHK
jgi:hypothetical protein